MIRRPARNRFIATIAAAFVIGVATTSLGGMIEVQTGTLNITDDGQTSFESFSFSDTFATAPVVVTLATNDGTDPTAIRIRNVTSTGFEATMVEPTDKDGQHGAAMTNVTFLAVEPGEFTIGSLKGYAGTTTLNHNSTVGRQDPFTSGGSHKTVSLPAGYFSAAPIVLGDLQTMVNESLTDPPPGGPSVPWMTTSMVDLTASDFKVAIERAEVAEHDADPTADPKADFYDTPGTIADETLGYIAIEEGYTFFLDDDGVVQRVNAFLSTDSIIGWDDTGTKGAGVAVAYSAPAGYFSGTPRVVATMAKRDGIDGGWLRRGNIGTDSVFLTVDEDQYRDDERGHTDEAASVAVFSADFTANNPAVPEPSTVVLTALGILGFALYRWRHRR